jgi:putative ABC transport system substrate-binding protein
VTRRRFLLVLALPLAGRPLTASAQSGQRLPRIGVLGEQTPSDLFLAAFRGGLREAGYVEGQNIAVEYRYARGIVSAFSDLLGELIRAHVDVLVVGGTAAALAAKSQTTTIPIVFILPGDPVGTGLVASLARPGGNATGMSTLLPELSLKHLELLRTVVPRLSRVAVLYNPLSSAAALAVSQTQEAARTLKVDLQILEVRRPPDLAAAFTALGAQRPDALLPLSDPVFGAGLSDLARLATQHHLPSIYVRKEYVDAGGLMSYGPSFPDNYRRAALYVDKILKGARPADLPVEQPSKIDLVINARTARTLGVTIPQTLRLQADQIIE